MVTTKSVSILEANGIVLESLFDWLATVIDARMQRYFEDSGLDVWEIEPPEFTEGFWADLVQHYEMDVAEQIALLLALAPSVYPSVLDRFLSLNEPLNRGFTEFGGIRGKQHGGFLPTGETVLFVLAGGDLARRFEIQKMFDRDHFFSAHQLIRLEPAPKGEPRWAGQWVLNPTIQDLLTTGNVPKPIFSEDFPAQLLTSPLDWEHLVLTPETQLQMKELLAWVEYENVLLEDWGMAGQLKRGYCSLFHGGSGTGKTITATLIGKRVNRDVYRIDLSSVVSKYIGETEKNLEKIFSTLESYKAILFFDEADALFGKRTSIQNAHDRYANQEISYLLQRIEEYSGLVILASNFKTNMDEAFLRRFQSVISFPMPDANARLILWQQAFPTQIPLDPQLDLKQLAKKIELSGGAINNVVRYALLMALSRKEECVREEDISAGIKRELQKAGKTY
jgi:hypothetical protein